MQMGLFDAPGPRSSGGCEAAVDQPMRPYQAEAEKRSWHKLKDHRSTLVVLPTGAGKTRVFTNMIKFLGQYRGSHKLASDRALVLANRDELLNQARVRIAAETRELVGLEQAQFFGGSERVVVASIDTIRRDERLSRWGVNAFGLVVVDEAHHAVAPTWRKVLDHFAGAKILGVTATPDRTDERALGTVFDSVAYVYEIRDAIRDGWLCPIRVRPVHIESIDFSGLKTVDGDFTNDDLEQIIKTEKNLHGIAEGIIGEGGDRRVLGFTPGVESAHRLAEILNRYRNGYARAVDGAMDKHERRAILAGHKRGDFPALLNCQLTTEGYDDPTIAAIAMARPTKSRALYAQMVGRGLRPADGKVDCVVVEFTGNTGKHKLATAIDALGGQYSDEVIAKAKQKQQEEGMGDPMEALDLAREELEQERVAAIARRAEIIANVTYTASEVDPFAVMHMKTEDVTWDYRFGGKPASEGQVAALKKFRVDLPPGLTCDQAKRLMGACIVRMKKGLSSYGQIKKLSTFGVVATNWSHAHARDALDQIARNGWKMPKGGLRGYQRQAGEDG